MLGRRLPIGAIAWLVLGVSACRPSVTTAPVVTSAIAPADPRDRTPRMTDANITIGVLRRLMGDSALSGAVLRVTATNGTVQLRGTAPSLLAKDRAVRHAELLKGVRAVVDLITVQHASIADAELERDVRDALARDAATEGEDLHVRVDEGTVTLRGTVHSLAEKHLAATVTKGIRGVIAIRDEIDVVGGGARADAEIAADIASRLRWDVYVDDRRVTVSSRGGAVTLSGVVASAAEKRRAIADAWVAGATRIDADALRVDPWARIEDRRRDPVASAPSEAVARAVHDALVIDPRVDASRVDAEVAGGIATLRGHVASLAASRAAAQVAKDTVGVRAVANLLAVERPKPPADDELGRRISAALAVNPYTEGRDIVVTAANGAVTLNGTVDSIFTKAEAESVAASVSGVRMVANRVTARDPSRAYTTARCLEPYGRAAALVIAAPSTPAKQDSAIRADLERSLAGSPFLDPGAIHADVRDGRVVLAGAVHSWRGWLAASDAAWDAGAVDVENRLVLW